SPTGPAPNRGSAPAVTAARASRRSERSVELEPFAKGPTAGSSGCGARGGQRGAGIADQRRVVAELVDLGDPDPLEPVAEEGRLEVAAELGTELRRPHGARVDHGRALAAAREQRV